MQWAGGGGQSPGHRNINHHYIIQKAEKIKKVFKDIICISSSRTCCYHALIETMQVFQLEPQTVEVTYRPWLTNLSTNSSHQY